MKSNEIRKEPLRADKSGSGQNTPKKPKKPNKAAEND
jgi:hypothetical protein